ncbi:hypothetical protein L210DRAFT_3565426, partial [Boletus edulis BED1]
IVTLHPEFPECSRPPALAGVSQIHTGNNGMLRRSRDIYHDNFALLLKGTCFSVFDSMVASDRFCLVFYFFFGFSM